MDADEELLAAVLGIFVFYRRHTNGLGNCILSQTRYVIRSRGITRVCTFPLQRSKSVFRFLVVSIYMT